MDINERFAHRNLMIISSLILCASLFNLQIEGSKLNFYSLEVSFKNTLSLEILALGLWLYSWFKYLAHSTPTLEAINKIIQEELSSERNFFIFLGKKRLEKYLAIDNLEPKDLSDLYSDGYYNNPIHIYSYKLMGFKRAYGGKLTFNNSCIDVTKETKQVAEKEFRKDHSRDTDSKSLPPEMLTYHHIPSPITVLSPLFYNLLYIEVITITKYITNKREFFDFYSAYLISFFALLLMNVRIFEKL